MDEALNTARAAPIIGVTAGTLENWRVAGKGPKFRRAGRKVVYDLPDIEEWKAANRYSSTSEAA
jgi:hypothetical protein